MTEEILIDGVDVAGCISFDKNNGHNICCYDDTREDKIPFANFCVENKNCTYKQLKRLEQENFALTQESQQKSQTICELEQENRELKAYKNINEDFKKAWDELNKKYTEVLKLAKENADSNEYCLQELEQENKTLKDNNNHLQVIIDDGRAENKRFREENKELKEMLSKEPKAMQAFQIAYSSNKKENEVLWGMVKDYKMALEEINRVVKLAHKVEDYLLGQDYTDLVDRIQDKIDEVLQ